MGGFWGLGIEFEKEELLCMYMNMMGFLQMMTNLER